ncbi:sugar porter family MFS transporter [Aspergillus affinis]|uniref:sugar porter family MFS transporter n=1 Tax=Aspergillus affinis TaxID=1070780 RepID=UPI0022FED3E5|nr:putative sugar transporter [Aspergillus affinis]KAI9040571.1 putative sugar transporter [Aspergillus affinis]
MGAGGGGWSNEAIKRVPPQARGVYIWLAVIWASYCGGLHGFNTANISGTMSLKPFIRDFGWTELSKATVSDYSGWVVSSMLLGQTAGVLLCGPLGERRGRKPVIMGSAILYTIGAILMAANFGSLAELLVGRVLSGLGSGFGMVVGPIYISEVAPTEMRGMMTTFYNINIMAGVSGSYWINYASLEVLPATSSWQWRATLVLQLIPAIALFLGFPFFPESPRYLMLRGQAQASHDSLSRLRGLDTSNEYFAREFNELQARMTANAEPQSALQSFKSLLGSCITDPPTRKLLLFVVIVQTFFIMSGGNSITYYAPTILKSIGLDSTQILLFSAIYGLVKLVSVLLYAFILTDRFGRRPLLLIGSALNVICLCYLSVYLGVSDLSAKNTSPSPAAWVAIVAICVFAVGYGIGWAPAFSLTASEICPTPIRGTVVTLAFVYQNLLNFGITRGFPNMTVDMHAWGPFALFTAFTALATGWFFLAFPECKGRSMESADKLFSLPWWRIGFVRVGEDGDGGRVRRGGVEEGKEAGEEKRSGCEHWEEVKGRKMG